MDKLPNLKVEIDGQEFESSPVIANKVIGLATRDGLEEENKVAFVIMEGTQKLLVEVEKQNLKPFELSKAKELKIGMLAVITGQIAEMGLVFNEEIDNIRTIKAESVYFMEMNEVEPGIRKIMDECNE